MSSANPLPRALAAVAAIATLSALCLALIVARSRNAARQAGEQMRAVFSAQAPVIAQANHRERQRDRALAKTLEKISQAKRAPKNPQSIAASLPAAFPTLPEPLSVALPPAASDKLTAPTVITVPRDDLKPLFDHLQDCRACQQQLDAAQQDLRDERVKVSALMIERGTALKTARGGGFWSRLRTGAKWFAIGGVVGALAASAAHR